MTITLTYQSPVIRNLQQLNIPVEDYLHIYTDRKHLGSSSGGLLTALFSLFLTILPIIIIYQ